MTCSGRRTALASASPLAYEAAGEFGSATAAQLSVYVFPLKLVGASATPARVIAIIE